MSSATHLAHAEIGRPEMMRPFGQAMRFVDAGEGDGWHAREVDETARPSLAAANERLGRHEQEVELAVVHLIGDFLALRARHVGVEAGAVDPGRQVGDLQYSKLRIYGTKI